MRELLFRPEIVTALSFVIVAIVILLVVLALAYTERNDACEDEHADWRNAQSGGNPNLDFDNEIKSNEFICPHCLDVMGTWPEIREHIRKDHKDEMQWKSE